MQAPGSRRVRVATWGAGLLEYTKSIEAQIAEALRLRGRIGVDGIAGIDEEDARRFLVIYHDAHSAEPGLAFDGNTLVLRTEVREPAPQAVSPATDPVRPSPVEQVLAAPQGKSMLDSAVTGPPVSKWFWALPLSLGVLGGVIAWLIVRDTNPRVAKNLLVTGVVVQVLTSCMSCVLASAVQSNPALRSIAESTRGGSVAWPASASGRPVFYYFGTPN